MKLKDKVILVTGSASGLGRATALACARNGAALFMVDRDRDGLEVALSEQFRLEVTSVA